MGDYEKEERKWRDEYWRRDREVRARQHLIREKKIPNFIMTDGTPHSEEPMPPYPRRKPDYMSLSSWLVVVFVALLVLLSIYWLKNN